MCSHPLCLICYLDILTNSDFLNFGQAKSSPDQNAHVQNRFVSIMTWVAGYYCQNINLLTAIPQAGCHLVEKCQKNPKSSKSPIDLKYTHRKDIRTRDALEEIFRKKFETLNRVKLTDSEFYRASSLPAIKSLNPVTCFWLKVFRLSNPVNSSNRKIDFSTCLIVISDLPSACFETQNISAWCVYFQGLFYLLGKCRWFCIVNTGITAPC